MPWKWACPSSCEDSDIEEERPGVLDDALKDATGWINLDSTNNIPQLSIKTIHKYFIKRKIRKDQVSASKPFEQGYRVYDAKKVQSMSIYQTINDNLFSVIKAAVLPSQRTDKVYETIIVVYTVESRNYAPPSRISPRPPAFFCSSSCIGSFVSRISPTSLQQNVDIQSP